MSETGNRPLRPPLRLPAQPGDGRDREIFHRLDAEIAEEDNLGKEPAPAQRKRKTGAVARAGYRDARPRQNRPRPAKKPARPESEAFAGANEMTAQAAHDIRRQFGEDLTRDECLRLVSVFRAGMVPRRRAGRRPKPHVTAAYLDWKAGTRGVELYRKHIPGWEKHNRYRRRGEQKALMDAIRSRRRRERRSNITGMILRNV
jgi:hypothetical protein